MLVLIVLTFKNKILFFLLFVSIVFILESHYFFFGHCENQNNFSTMYILFETPFHLYFRGCLAPSRIPQNEDDSVINEGLLRKQNL